MMCFERIYSLREVKQELLKLKLREVSANCKAEECSEGVSIMADYLNEYLKDKEVEE